MYRLCKNNICVEFRYTYDVLSFLVSFCGATHDWGGCLPVNPNAEKRTVKRCQCPWANPLIVPTPKPVCSHQSCCILFAQKIVDMFSITEVFESLRIDFLSKLLFCAFQNYNALAVSKSGISALHMRTQVLDMSTNTFQCGAQPTGLLDQSYPPLVQHGLLEHAGTSTMASSVISLENPPSMVDFPVCSYGFPTMSSLFWLGDFPAMEVIDILAHSTSNR